VIKVLEEAGIQADVVTGTSMGSIIGALHAIGYTGEDLSKVNREADWDILLTNDIPFNRIFLPEKYNYERFLIDLPVSSEGFEIPAGLIDGQELSLLFSRLTFLTAGIRHFDDYSLPFSCVSADIVDAETVVFDAGDLATAMRSSMTIPSVFPPVLIDSSTLLFDGMWYCNFPAQEAIDMVADYLIGVYVGFPDKVNAEDLKGLASILARTTLLSGTKDVQQQNDLVDFIIYPDLEGLSTGSFGKGL
jgi:NTE family protein